jgi:hypothetical protein
VKLVEGISPRYLPSVRDISGDLFISGDLVSALTSVRGGDFKVSGFCYPAHTVDLNYDCSLVRQLYSGLLVG